MCPVETVQRGDILDFQGYALRIETDPIRDRNWIRLAGRKSTDGSPYVHKAFLIGTLVNVRPQARKEA
jgi:hypothetical protein